MGRRPDPKIREAIIREAEHLIHLHGFHQTSMGEIARSCKMTKANLFHHFGGKEDLGLAVLDVKMAESRKKQVDPLCVKCDPSREVRRLFSDASRFYNGNGCKAGCFIGNTALEMSDISEPFRKRVSLFFKEWVAGMSACVKRAQKAGHLDRDLSPRAAAESILSLYQGAIMLARTTRDATIFDRVGRVACSILEKHRTGRPRPKAAAAGTR